MQLSRQGQAPGRLLMIIAILWVGLVLGVSTTTQAATADTTSTGATAEAARNAMPPGMAGKTLRVGTKVAPPFVMHGDDQAFNGLSIALWQSVAKTLGLQTNYVERPLKGLFTGLQDGSLDVSVAALTVTEAREARIDFTFPFYTTGLAIAVPAQGGSPIWATIKRFFSWQFLTALLTLAALLAAVGIAVWAFERHRNAEEFGGSTLHGVFSGFWWAAVTMTTVGYGDKSPRTPGGRLVGLVWMFAAIIIISSFTAAIATSLTVGSLATGVQSVNDLHHVRVLTVADSAAADALKTRGIGFSERQELDDALAALAAGRTDAVVFDAPLLKYRVRQKFGNSLTVLDNTFDRQDYAFALPQGSPLREPINRAILVALDDSHWNQLVKRFVGNP